MRSGRMTEAQSRAITELWSVFGFDYENKPLDFTRLFERVAPVVVEIGLGNGETLSQHAANQPEYNFLGI